MACLAVLDILLALSRYSRCGEGAMCQPQLTLPSEDVMVVGVHLAVLLLNVSVSVCVNNNNNNERISRAPFHVKHAQLR